MRFQSRPFQLVGFLAFLVGLVGYTLFGWRFDSTGNPVVTGLAIVCVVVAVAATVLRGR
ncbi:hypothetical protein [Haladaptatus sp. NG-SE-30]